MKKHLLILLTILLTSSTILFAQIGGDVDSIDWGSKLKTTVKLDKPVYKPVLGVGMGNINFYGEVKNKYFKDFTYGTTGFNVDVYRAMDSCFKFGFRFLYGTINSSRYDLDPKKNFNFQTKVMTFGTDVMYNFANTKFIGNSENKILSPYVSLGFEFVNFESFGDLYDAKGNKYYNWSDGTVRNIDESLDPSHSKGIKMVRDGNYETSLKDKNLDGIKTSPLVLSFPIELGCEFIISPKASLKLGYSYHYTLSDNIDNITSKGKGSRKGTKGYDAFSYSYIQFNLDLFSKTTEEKQLQFIDLGSGMMDFWDTDGDYIMDVYDQCPMTPPGVLVDTLGCPFDDDKDHYANYADSELTTPRTAFYVDIIGKEVSKPIMLALLNDTASLSQQDIYRHYPNLLEGTGLYHRFYKSIPAKFKSVDTNGDDYISLEEILNAINMFFDSQSDLKVDDLYELGEFFFIQ
jgi:hypothetical protein